MVFSTSTNLKLSILVKAHKESLIGGEFMHILKHDIQEQFMMSLATVKDTTRVLHLLTETAKWFQQNGSTQWSDLLKGIDAHNTTGAIQRGDVFICTKEEELAGMVMLLQTPSEWDCRLWELTDEAPNDAIYLHRLAINRKYAHYKLGQSIVNWCKNDIQFEGKKKVRLDCVAHNEFLNAFYQKIGFTYVGEKAGYSLYEYHFL